MVQLWVYVAEEVEQYQHYNGGDGVVELEVVHCFPVGIGAP